MIGSGVFLKPSQVAVATQGYVGLILTLWIVLGLVNLCGALALAELSAMFPRSGGTYLFLREAYGPLWAFSWAWAEFCIIRSGSIATLAAAMAITIGEFAAASALPLRPMTERAFSMGSIIMPGFNQYHRDPLGRRGAERDDADQGRLRCVFSFVSLRGFRVT